MVINNDDLELLIEIENYLGTHCGKKSNGMKLAWRLVNLNEKLITQRAETREKTRLKVAEKRKNNPDYARGKKGV